MPSFEGLAVASADRADGDAARAEHSRRRGVDLRTEMGRLSLHRVSRWRRNRAAVEIGRNLDALLPRDRRRAQAGKGDALRYRRRAAHHRRRGRRFRRAPPTHPSGRQPRPPARRGDSGHVRALRPPRARQTPNFLRTRCASAAHSLEVFVAKNFPKNATIALSPATDDIALARRWFAGDLARLDGIIAKRDVPYAFGSRDAAVKVKRSYAADCVIGGFRTGQRRHYCVAAAGALRRRRLLHHVGFVGSMSAQERKRAAEQLKPIVEPPGFTGAAPGGPSRWRREASEWFPVKPQSRRRGELRSRHRAAVSARDAAAALAPR